MIETLDFKDVYVISQYIKYVSLHSYFYLLRSKSKFLQDKGYFDRRQWNNLKDFQNRVTIYYLHKNQMGLKHDILLIPIKNRSDMIYLYFYF